MLADHRTLLIDLENVLGTPRPRASVLRAWAESLLQAAEPVHHAVAAYTAAESGDYPNFSVLAELRIAPLPVAPGQDAAELALLAHAQHVHRAGGRVFLVASSDRRFAELAALDNTRIEVFARDGQPVATKLSALAAHVHRLPRNAMTTAVPEADIEPEHPGAETSARDTSSLGRVAARIGLALITGFGVALGQRLLDLVVPRGRPR